ncbi:MAG: hypothetical protein WCJ99_15285 [Betaproteobacteria bacterium]|jgi:hypothetical protein
MRTFIFLLAFLGLLQSTQVWSEDKPEPKFKPYPTKKSSEDDSSAKPSSTKSTALGSSSSTSSMLSNKPFGVEPTLSLKHRPPSSGKEPMLRLDSKLKPLTEPVYENDRLTFYECQGVLGPWFQELLTAEMNYFNELVELPMVNGQACVVGIGTLKSLTAGRINVQLYASTRQMNDCIRDDRCPIFRSVSLISKNDNVYRSYFLSDLNRKLISQQCVTSKGKLHSDTTCYTVN